MQPAQTGEIIDSCLNDSRAAMFEICTSTTGVLTTAIASRIATEVCV